MQRIRFKSLWGEMEGIPLATYSRKDIDFQMVTKRFLWFTRAKRVPYETVVSVALVFVPYKHREKQLIEIAEGAIIGGIGALPPDWISVSSFVSKAYDEEGANGVVEITNFHGYDFIVRHNAFLCDQALGNLSNTLSLLYQEMPELLREEFDEEARA